jgi:GH24 family phage-related lysozyme (muramidase)
VKASRAARLFIQRFVPLNTHAHQTAGGWEIGYGHRGTGREPYISPSDHITVGRAGELLDEDLKLCAKIVASAIKVDLATHEFDALVCEVYFMPYRGEFKDSEIAHFVNRRNKEAAAEAMSRGKLPRAIARRQAALSDFFLGEN